MKIIYITNDFPPEEGGMEINAFYTVKYLSKFFNVKVITKKNITNKEDLPLNYNNLHIKRFKFPKNYIFKNIYLSVILSFYKLIFQYDFILLNTWSPFGLSALFIKKVFNTKYFITAHGLDVLDPLKSKHYTFLMKIVFKNSTRIFPVSNFTKNVILKNVPIPFYKLKVISNALNEKDFLLAPQNLIKEEEEIKVLKSKYNLYDCFVLITVSRIVERKGHLLVLKALSLLLKQGYKVKYIIVGQGQFKTDLLKYVSENNLFDNVIFTGYVPFSKLKYYYYVSDLFVMPSQFITETGDVEGFGISYLEANITGLPAIGLNQGGVSDVIKDNFNGYLIKEYSVNELFDIINKFISDKKYYSDISGNCKNYVLNNYLWSDNIKKLCDYITFFKRKNILFLTHRDSIGGGEISLKEIILNISEKVNKIVLAGACSDYFWNDIDLKYNIKISPLKKINVLTILKLYYLVKKHNITIIHCNTTRTVFYAVIVNIICFNSLKIIWHNRGTDKRSVIEKYLSYFVHKMIGISEAVKKSILNQGVNEEKVVRIYNGIDFNRLDNIKSDDNIFQKSLDSFFIGIIGRLTVEKNHITLLKAFKKLINNRYNLKLVIVGDDKFGKSAKSEIFNHIKEYKLDEYVIYYQNIINLKSLFQKLDLLIIPSHREAFGRVIIESMYYNVPVIGSAVDGIKEIIQHNENGLLYYPPENYNELSDTIIKLYNSVELRKKIVSNGYKTAIKFSINTHIEELSSIL